MNTLSGHFSGKCSCLNMGGKKKILSLVSFCVMLITSGLIVS